jgi:hypothetical protein
MQPLYPSPAKLRGSAQLIPRSKFLSDGVAILNLRLDVFHFDTGDLGKILEPFANAFFPEGGDGLLIYKDILFDLSAHWDVHQQNMEDVFRHLSAARCAPQARNLADGHLTSFLSG